LDLLLSKEGFHKYTGYELKANQGSVEEFKNQTIGYAFEHGIDIYLVNFISMHKKIDLDLLKWSVADGGPNVIMAYVQYNDDYTHYTIRCMGKSIPVQTSRG
jgi:hypothetical protein